MFCPAPDTSATRPIRSNNSRTIVVVAPFTHVLDAAMATTAVPLRTCASLPDYRQGPDGAYSSDRLIRPGESGKDLGQEEFESLGTREIDEAELNVPYAQRGELLQLR